jgi:hypothetical protein
MRQVSIPSVTQYTTMPAPPSPVHHRYQLRRRSSHDENEPRHQLHNLTTKGMVVAIAATITGNNANNINGKAVRMLGRQG